MGHFGLRSTHKAIPVIVNGSNFGKTIFRKYKGVIYDLKAKKKFGLGLKKISFSVVLGLRGIILPPPIMGQSKIVCYKPSYLSITSNETL
jgi:hypothetical protein